MTFPVVTRGPLVLHTLIWVEAVNISTGLSETMGLWTGLDHRSFTINGTSRDYFGAGAVLSVPAITTQVGLSVTMQEIGLNILSPEVEQLIRGYDVRNAPIEIHLARFDPDTSAILGVHRVFKGTMDRGTIREGGKNAESTYAGELASSARRLTRRVPDRISDQSHQRAHPGDAWFRYADVSGAVPVFWGQERKR